MKKSMTQIAIGLVTIFFCLAQSSSFAEIDVPKIRMPDYMPDYMFFSDDIKFYPIEPLGRAIEPPTKSPLQEWIYVAIQSPTWNGGKLYIAVMTKQGGIPYTDTLDLATVTYKFDGTEKYVEVMTKDGKKEKRFDFLQNCFGIKTITPAQIGDLFGSNCVVTYAYLYNWGPNILHTANEIAAGVNSGRVDQNSVTLRIVDH